MEYITKICKWCNQPFQAKVKQVYSKGKPNGKKCLIDYCSQSCKSNGLAKAAKKADHSKQIAEPNVICPICKEPFYRAPRKIKRGTGIYCSRACAAVSKSKAMIGNQFGKGIKQSPERIAHRVSFMIGDKNPCWNGGVTYHKGRGKKLYKYIKCPDEFIGMATNHGYVAEHRLIVARSIGRPLTSKEVVHHINHNTLDNRIENLELFSDNTEHKLFEGKTGYFKEYWSLIRRTRTNPQNSQ